MYKLRENMGRGATDY